MNLILSLIVHKREFLNSRSSQTGKFAATKRHTIYHRHVCQNIFDKKIKNRLTAQARKTSIDLIAHNECQECQENTMPQEHEIAKILLEKQAVTLNVETPYTYVSGIRSPSYCDNRRLIFFPQERRRICQAFCRQVEPLMPDMIAGIATSAIPWAAWVAEQLEKPLVYIRKESKGYGKQQLIEGGDIQGKTVVVIEDLVSTGGSSLNAVNACREASAKVLALVAIFTYEFANVVQKFQDVPCEVRFLTNFTTLTQVAAEYRFIDQSQLALIQEWNKDPQDWGPRLGFPNAEPKN
jgi:orotate phosphoribosyltransferase